MWDTRGQLGQLFICLQGVFPCRSFDQLPFMPAPSKAATKYLGVRVNFQSCLTCLSFKVDSLGWVLFTNTEALLVECTGYSFSPRLDIQHRDTMFTLLRVMKYIKGTVKGAENGTRGQACTWTSLARLVQCLGLSPTGNSYLSHSCSNLYL